MNWPIGHMVPCPQVLRSGQPKPSEVLRCTTTQAKLRGRGNLICPSPPLYLLGPVVVLLGLQDSKCLSSKLSSASFPQVFLYRGTRQTRHLPFLHLSYHSLPTGINPTPMDSKTELPCDWQDHPFKLNVSLCLCFLYYLLSPCKAGSQVL